MSAPRFRYRGRARAFAVSLAAVSQVAGFCAPVEPDPSQTTTFDCEPTTPAPAAGVVELGKTVDRRFASLGADELRPMERGFQGGQHFYISLRAAWSEPARFVYELILEDPSTGQRLGGAYGAVAACPGQFAVVHDELVFVLDANTTGGVLRLVGHFEDASSGARLFEPGPNLNTVRLSPPS